MSTFPKISQIYIKKFELTTAFMKLTFSLSIYLFFSGTLPLKNSVHEMYFILPGIW